MSEIRENRLTGEWVIIAPERAGRGGNLASPGSRVEIPPLSATCPFCPGNEVEADERFRSEDGDGWSLRSVANKFSALSPSGPVEMPDAARPGEVCLNGVGLHEVLVENPRHDATIAESPVAQVQRILEAYRHRFLAFHDDSRVRHVIIFKNHGADAGASQQHPHSQIVGLPMIPGQVVDRIERARRFFLESGRCLSCTLMEQERGAGERIVAENADFVAFVPHAALSPFHLWIFPKAHTACFSEDSALPALAEILRAVLAKVHGLLGGPAFNLVIRSLSPQEKDAEHFHWYVSIIPRVNKAAGFELGTGMYINPSSPEVSARVLREFETG